MLFEKFSLVASLMSNSITFKCLWHRGVVDITTAQLHLRFFTGSNQVCDDVNLQQWSRLKTRANVFLSVSHSANVLFCKILFLFCVVHMTQHSWERCLMSQLKIQEARIVDYTFQLGIVSNYFCIPVLVD